MTSPLNCSIMCPNRAIFHVGNSSIPLLRLGTGHFQTRIDGKLVSQSLYRKNTFSFPSNIRSKKVISLTPRSSDSSNSSSSSSEDGSSNQEKARFGYNRKDVLLIGIGVTVLGIGLKSGLEFVGVDPLQAGNVVQLILVLGLTVGWIFTYIFRVSNKEMTYAQQLRDYEYKVMEKRLEGLTEAELAALLEQVEEEKRQMASGEQIN
ncbi:uncharacterized protein [Euphorbia lathyris]|uniref:uncharacterized protein n=1 Tax=Euphorbia lathyris TaxID=212925 RepID=UPI00331324ED